MRTIKRLNLDKLAETMPVIPEIDQSNFVGGNKEYTYAEALALIRSGKWEGGYISDRGYYLDVLIGSGMWNSFYIGPTSDLVLNEYSPRPMHAADYIAQQHDLDYQELNLSGVLGTLSKRSKEADQRLVDRCYDMIQCYNKKEPSYYSGYIITKDAYDAANKMITYFDTFGHLDFLL